jgi:hypothetical protein
MIVSYGFNQWCGSNRMAHSVLQYANRVATVLVCLLFSLGFSPAAAQGVCPFVVAGGTSPRFAVDGALLLRYPIGRRDQTLAANLALSLPSHADVINAIQAHQSTRLDLDGDGFFTNVDPMVAARYMAGFAPELWLMGLSLPVTANRRSGAFIADFIAAGRPKPSAEAARVLAVLPRGDKVSVNAPIVVFFSNAMNTARAQAAIATSPPVS